MPRYEYRCDSCGDTFEVQQKFSDPPLEVHPTCGGHVERLISAPAIQFKGSGWYVTDYAKGSSSKPAEQKDGADAKPAASSGVETKPESKASAEAPKPAAEK